MVFISEKSSTNTYYHLTVNIVETIENKSICRVLNQKFKANGLVGSHLGTGSNLNWVFKGPMGRCKATTPSSLSLPSKWVTTNY